MDGVRLVRSHALVGAALLGLAVLVGCSRDSGAKGAAGNAGPYAKEVSEAVPKIERAVGLTFKKPPRVERRSKDEVRNFLTQKFNESMPAAEISGIERAYRRFGLMSDTLQLRPFMLELLTEQVVGYYDPSTKVLYVVDGADPNMVGVTVTHELRACAAGPVPESRFDPESHRRQRPSGRCAGSDRGTGDVRASEGDARLEQSLRDAARWMGSHSRHDSRRAKLDAGVLVGTHDHSGDADLPVSERRRIHAPLRRDASGQSAVRLDAAVDGADTSPVRLLRDARMRLRP